jgi:hypothetical protein
MQWHSLLLLYTTMDEKARETRIRSHGKNETGGHRPIAEKAPAIKADAFLERS